MADAAGIATPVVTIIEKMDHVRRREMAKLDYESKRTIKGHRILGYTKVRLLLQKGRTCRQTCKCDIMS